MKHIEELYVDVINFSAQHDGKKSKIADFKKDLLNHLKKVWKSEAEKSMRECSLINRNHVAEPVTSNNIKSISKRSKAQVDEIKDYIHRLKGEGADIPEAVKNLESVSTEIDKIVELFDVAVENKMVLEECLEHAMAGDFAKIMDLDKGSKTLEEKISDDYENRLGIIKSALKKSDFYPYEKIRSALSNEFSRIKKSFDDSDIQVIRKGTIRRISLESLFDYEQIASIFLGAKRGESGFQLAGDPEKEIEKLAEARSDTYCEGYGKKIIRIANQIEMEQRSKGEISVSDIKIASNNIEIKCSLKIEGKYHDISFKNEHAFNSNTSNLKMEFGGRDSYLQMTLGSSSYR